MEREFSHRGLGKKMPIKEVVNKMVVWSDTSSDDKKIGCDPFKRCCIEATIKGKMLENILNNMEDNDDVEVPYFLPAIEQGIMDTREIIVDLPWMRACQIWKPYGSFWKDRQMEVELAVSRALVEERKAKIEKLEHNLVV